jgi:hypothetical protein
LEVLSDFQVTIPEYGTIKAAERPAVIITTNSTREIHDALKRRCLYHWVDYPTPSGNWKSSRRKAPDGQRSGCREEVVPFVQRCADGVVQGAGCRRDNRLGDRAHRTRQGRPRSGTISDTIGVLLKYQDDIARLQGSEGKRMLDDVKANSRGVTMESFPPEPRTAPAGRRGPACRQYRLFRPHVAQGRVKVGPAAVNDAIEAVLCGGIGIARRFLLDPACRSCHPARGQCRLRRGVPALLAVRDLGRKDAAMFSPKAPDTRARKKKRAAESRVAEAMFEGHKNRESRRKRPPEIEVDARMTFSGTGSVARKDFAQMTTAELAQAKKAFSELRLPMDEVKTRRYKPSRPQVARRSAPHDAAGTLRTGGDLIIPQFREPRFVHPPLVVCGHIRFDEPVHAPLLHFLHALTENAGTCTLSCSGRG